MSKQGYKRGRDAWTDFHKCLCELNHKIDGIMAVTYTNRRGHIFYLCRGVTKSGKQRYYFSRKPKDELMEEIPPGYEIQERADGRVNLIQLKRKYIKPEEVQLVEKELAKHPKGDNYLVEVTSKMITIYEQDYNVSLLLLEGVEKVFNVKLPAEKRKELIKKYEKDVDYSPILRFILRNKEKRLFDVDRMSFLGKEGWYSVEYNKLLDKLVKKWVPLLDTEEFFMED